MNVRSSLVTALVLLIASTLGIAGCKKSPASMSHEEKAATLSEPGQRLAHHWKLDVNASAAENSKAAEKATGIKSDLKLQGDVGKIAQFAAKAYFFGFEPTSLKTVYEEKYGEGFLSTSSTGWWDLAADGVTLTLRGTGKKTGKDSVYTVKQLDEDKLVLADAKSGVIEVFTAR